jgi:hypothetical protein
MTSEQGSGSGDGKRTPRDRILDVPAGSRNVDVASHGETVEFMKVLRGIVESHQLEGQAAYEKALRAYLATVPPEKRKRIARGILAALPGPRPTPR